MASTKDFESFSSGSSPGTSSKVMQSTDKLIFGFAAVLIGIIVLLLVNA